MNVFFILLLISIIEDAPSFPEHTRANTRSNRAKAIAHNKAVYHSLVGGTTWFEEPDEDGVYRRWASGQFHANNQEGRWATMRLSGHRRYQKVCKNYYPSWQEEKEKCWDKADKRWEARYGE